MFNDDFLLFDVFECYLEFLNPILSIENIKNIYKKVNFLPIKFCFTWHKSLLFYIRPPLVPHLSKTCLTTSVYMIRNTYLRRKNSKITIILKWLNVITEKCDFYRKFLTLKEVVGRNVQIVDGISMIIDVDVYINCLFRGRGGGDD